MSYLGLGGLSRKIKASTPAPNKVTSDYLALIEGFSRGQPTVLAAEQTYKPQYIEQSISGMQSAYPSVSGLFSDARTSNVADAARLGPSAGAATRATWDATNPESAALLAELTNQASLGLKAGSTLDPQSRWQAMAPSRDAASRGFAPGSQAQDLDQALAFFAGGENLRRSRQDFAGGVFNQNAAVQNQLFPAANALATQEGNAPTFAAGLATAAGPTIIPPASSYDTFNTAYNANAAAQINATNANAAKNAIDY